MIKSLTCAALVFATAAHDAPQPAAQAHDRLSGIYSNVEFTPGWDLTGIEIEIHADVPNPYAEFILCEVWCRDYDRIPVKIEGNSFELVYPEQLCNPDDGSLARVNEIRFRGWRTRSGVVLEDRSKPGWGRQKLKRRKERFGLGLEGQKLSPGCVQRNVRQPQE